MFLLPIDEEEDLVEKNVNKDKQEKTQDKQEKTNDKEENSIEKSGQKQKENEEKKKDLKAIEKYLDNKLGSGFQLPFFLFHPFFLDHLTRCERGFPGRSLGGQKICFPFCLLKKQESEQEIKIRPAPP